MAPHRPIRALTTLVLLVGTLWALHSCTGLTIPVGSPDELANWAESTPPTIMAAALVRLAALGAAAYCAGMVSLLLVADAIQSRSLGRAVLVASPAVLRRAVGGGAAQVALVAGAMVATAPVVSAQDGGGGQPTATMTRVEPVPAPVATMAWLGPVDPGPPRPPPPLAETPPLAEMSETPDDDDLWRVEPGDSFWSIAEGTVGSGGDITAYWQRLIAANRDRLVAPACPDLLIPGQTLVLPPP